MTGKGEEVPDSVPYELEFERSGECLSVRARGIRTRETVVSVAMAILEECSKEKVSKVLVDVRGLEGGLPASDAYEIATVEFPKIREAGVLKKAAIVDREDRAPNLRFLGTVATNRGYNLHVGTDPGPAMEWLLEE